MSKIESITINNFRGIKSLETTSLSERLIILIGRGDSGKSTILNMLGGIDQNDDGQIIIGGKDLSAMIFTTKIFAILLR